MSESLDSTINDFNNTLETMNNKIDERNKNKRHNTSKQKACLT